MTIGTWFTWGGVWKHHATSGCKKKKLYRYVCIWCAVICVCIKVGFASCSASSTCSHLQIHSNIGHTSRNCPETGWVPSWVQLSLQPSLLSAGPVGGLSAPPHRWLEPKGWKDLPTNFRCNTWSTAKHSEAHGIASAVGRDQGQGSSATFVAERCILDSFCGSKLGYQWTRKMVIGIIAFNPPFLRWWFSAPHDFRTWWAWSPACLPCGIARYAEKSSSVGSVRRQSKFSHLSVNGWNISTFLWKKKKTHLYSGKSSTMNGYEWIGMVDVTSLHYVSSKRYWQMHKLHGMSWKWTSWTVHSLEPLPRRCVWFISRWNQSSLRDILWAVHPENPPDSMRAPA